MFIVCSLLGDGGGRVRWYLGKGGLPAEALAKEGGNDDFRRRPKKFVSQRINGLASKNDDKYILLTTFRVGGEGFRAESMV